MHSGEAWERGYRRRKMLIMIVAAIVSGLAVVVVKVAGDESVVFPGASFGSAWHLPLPARIAVAVLFFAGLGIVARWNWLASDEVRRSHMLSFWAAIGISVGVTFFGFMLFGRYIPEDSRLPLAFIARDDDGRAVRGRPLDPRRLRLVSLVLTASGPAS